MNPAEAENLANYWLPLLLEIKEPRGWAFQSTFLSIFMKEGVDALEKMALHVLSAEQKIKELEDQVAALKTPDKVRGALTSKSQPQIPFTDPVPNPEIRTVLGTASISHQADELVMGMSKRFEGKQS